VDNISITILAALIISLIAHEACHALALWTIGAPIRIIQFGSPVLYRRGSFSLGLIPFFGGVEGDFTGISIIRQIWFYAAGPVGSIMLGLGALLTGISLDLYSIKLLGIVSLAFGAFNLIPVPPMDGHRLVTLGRKVPYQVQVAWAVAGWTLIAVVTLCGSR
jgi:Zn-dependent protease